MDEQDEELEVPMSSVTRIVNPAALLVALTLFLMLAPCVSAVAHAQTPREAADEADNDDENGAPPRSGLGWTGIGLVSAGGLLLAGSFTFNDSKGCGFFNELACRDVGRVYGTTGGIMVATGLTFLIRDDVRRHPKPSPKRQTAISIGPRAIQVRVLF